MCRAGTARIGGECLAPGGQHPGGVGSKGRQMIPPVRGYGAFIVLRSMGWCYNLKIAMSEIPAHSFCAVSGHMQHICRLPFLTIRPHSGKYPYAKNKKHAPLGIPGFIEHRNQKGGDDTFLELFCFQHFLSSLVVLPERLELGRRYVCLLALVLVVHKMGG